ncbi:hypothetical protein HHK36_018958 [Tetracentron sinense]|uniref:Protein kinase domain-containing protein n=1 Tax=Tetracentron sinense TaxID=13715 RepID=A0A834YT29_TETSI|nr:hypothetical protein HHK36_018958 [Tetracentron sinense]
MGPLLNAFEMSKYMKKNDASVDGAVIANLVSHYLSADWAREGGDPCLLVPCHLENNQLTGELPSSLVDLHNLKKLCLQNNMLSGTIPWGLLNKKLVLKWVSSSPLVQRNQPAQRLVSSLPDAGTESIYCFTLSEIEDATRKFEKEIGSGGFGVVYYGEMKDGKEIAVKVLTRPLTHERSISWINRLEIAEDAAKGIEYLHTGCAPKTIHRDLKSSSILLDKHMRAKYYISQQLTEKSDVYGFGVILLELISGQEAISNETFGSDCRYIVQWAKLHIESGDIQGITDPSLRNEYDIQSVWKIAKKAFMCTQPRGSSCS